VETSGPDVPKCADLTIAIKSSNCHCSVGPTGGFSCTLTVTAVVTNAGPGDAGPFHVTLNSSCGTAVSWRTTTLLANNTWTTTLTTSPFSCGVPCPCCDFTVTVDAYNEVPECPPWGELNNTDTGQNCDCGPRV